MGKRIIFTVTNELNFDQRMQRIAGSLAEAGYEVCLVGVEKKTSPPLQPQLFQQKRIQVFFNTGKLFYLEYNLKLFFYLLLQPASILGAIDLDTILPVYLVSKLKNLPRTYDAHELFCEMKEVVSRPAIYKTWKWLEQWLVPKFRIGYTVNEPIAAIFKKDYGVAYEVIRNVPRLSETSYSLQKEPFLLYQGAVNEGRLFEILIPAMKWVNMPLHIYGDGNFFVQTQQLIIQHGLEQKVFLKGKLSPAALKQVTATATLGFTLFEKTGMSNYLSLANRFFDYIHAATPQICISFPVYEALNKDLPVASLVHPASSTHLAEEINKLLQNRLLYEDLQQNCLIRRLEWNWENEEKVLRKLYQTITL